MTSMTTTTKTMLRMQLDADELRALRRQKLPALPPLVHEHQLASGDQRSDTWFECRRNYVTASEMDRLMMADTCVGKNQLLHEKALPWLRRSTYTNSAMQFGVDNERLALHLFEQHTDVAGRLRSCLFCCNPAHPDIGGSPDAVLVGADDPRKVTAVVEVKCPVRPYDRVPHKYVLQMTTYMAVLDVRRCYLVQLSQNNWFSVTRFSLDANLFADMALKSRAFMPRVRAHRDNLQRARLFLLAALNKHEPRRVDVDTLLAVWLHWSPVKFAASTAARSRGAGKRRAMELSDEPPDSLLG